MREMPKRCFALVFSLELIKEASRFAVLAEN